MEILDTAYRMKYEYWNVATFDVMKQLFTRFIKTYAPKYFIDASLLLELAYSICALVNLINYRYTFMFRRTLQEAK